MKQFNKVKGDINEELAVNYLVNEKRFKIIERNYKCQLGEIDIIAKEKDGTIVFVEVKYRRNTRFGYGREAVDQYKQQKIRNVATYYLRLRSKLQSKVKFAVIDILDDKITFIDNAF
ncbi:MAG: YraN family protein [Clostridia bacterium]|nr:YraN family protein [Clostridia bacterium]